MIPGASHLTDMIARLEALMGRLEAGEPVLARLQSMLERDIATCAMPVAEDVTGVKLVLERILRHPSSRHLRELRAAVDEALASAPTEGPTHSARANDLLGLALAALQDPSLDFAGPARAYSFELSTLATHLAAGGASAPEGLREEVGRAVDAANRARDALHWLEEAVHGGLEDAVRQEGEAFIAAMGMMASAQRALERIAEQQGKTPCIRCGRYNPGDRSTCEECGAILPAAARTDESVLDVRVGEFAGPRETQMTVNLARILDACDRFYAGALDPEGFLEEVAWMEGLLEQARRMGFEEEAKQGLEEFAEGLGWLRQAGEAGEPALVDQGRRMIWEGAGRMQSTG